MLPQARMMTVVSTRAFLVLAFALFFIRNVNSQEQESSVDYGVDASYPMHYTNLLSDYDNNPLGAAPAQRYHNFIEGCVTYYDTYKPPKGHLCRSGEADRIEMALRQPAGLLNYTTHGFAKLRAPDAVMQLLRNFWEKNRGSERREQWAPGNIYTNHWESPTKLLNVADYLLDGGGVTLKQHIWDAARTTLESWTGQRLAECSLYGIRIYERGAMLAPHVDRLPLVSSAIINVDQDVDEPWPLEVIGHDGRAHNITMEPGDMVLYESHSVIHGRQFPLQGKFMANVFIHFGTPTTPIKRVPTATSH